MSSINKRTLFLAAVILVGGCDKKSDSDKASEAQVDPAKVTAPVAKQATAPAKETGPKPKAIAAPADDWKRHAFADHGFSIEAPSEPSVDKDTIKTEQGDTPMETISMSRPGVQGTLAVAVSTFSIPEGVKPNVEQALKDATNTTLGGGTALVNDTLTIGGHPATRLTFSDSKNFGASLGPVSGDMLHIYVAPNKMIIVGGIHKNGDAGRATITARFVNSFKFDDAAAK